MVRRLAGLRPLALPALLIGIVLGVFGWAAAFTSIGSVSIIIGTVAVAAAGVPRPTWRFILVCLLASFCIVAAVAGD